MTEALPEKQGRRPDPPSGGSLLGASGGGQPVTLGRDGADHSLPALSVRNLRKLYPIRRGEPRVAVEDVSFEVGRQEFICIVGPSGAGKTTVLRCLAGLMPPSGGEALFEGQPIRRVPSEVGVVFQDYSRSLFPWLSVAKNVAIPLKVRKVKKPERERRVEEVLASVGLAGVASNYPWQLSGGMQQRVAIARALVYQPELLFMDEPFASVDAQTRFELEDLIQAVRHEFGVTVVFVTHDIDEAVYLADRIIVLSPAPAVVRQVVDVPLAQPRDQLTTKADERFVELRGSVLRLVMGEPGPLDRGQGTRAAS